MSNTKSSYNPKVVYDFDPNNLPPEYLKAIGLAVAASAQTESILNHLIGSMLGIDNVQTYALALHMSFPLKNDIIRTFAELDSPTLEELDALDELMDQVKEAVDKRNTIVHNAFARHPATNQVYSLRQQARGSLKADLLPISLEEINQAAKLIYEAGMAVVQFMLDRNMDPKQRTSSIRMPPKRSKKAREDRRSGKL